MTLIVDEEVELHRLAAAAIHFIIVNKQKGINEYVSNIAC